MSGRLRWSAHFRDRKLQLGQDVCLGLLTPGPSILHSTSYQKGSQGLLPPHTSHGLRENSHREPTLYLIGSVWILQEAGTGVKAARDSLRELPVQDKDWGVGESRESSQMQGRSSPLGGDGGGGRREARKEAPPLQCGSQKLSARPKEDFRQVAARRVLRQRKWPGPGTPAARRSRASGGTRW